MRKIKVILCPSLSPDIVNIINACLVKDLSKLMPQHQKALFRSQPPHESIENDFVILKELE
jgi:hypothetical protein